MIEHLFSSDINDLFKPFNATHICQNRHSKEYCYGVVGDQGQMFIAATLSTLFPLNVELEIKYFDIKPIGE